MVRAAGLPISGVRPSPCSTAGRLRRTGCRSRLLSWGALALLAVLEGLTPPATTAQAAIATTPDAVTPPASEPNPYLAFLPAEAKPHWQYWRRQMAKQARVRGTRLAAKAGPRILQSEAEAPGTRGANDLPGLAEPVLGFGSAPSQVSAATLSGALLPLPTAMPPFAEPDGAIPIAPTLSLAQGERVTFSGRIGDGAYGSAGTGSGDFDVVALTGRALQRVDVGVRATGPDPSLDPAVLVFDATGSGIAFGDDTIRGGFYVSADVAMTFVLPRDGTYYLFIGGQHEDFVLGLRDPFDAGSGTGVSSEGDYQVLVGLDLSLLPDADYFAVPLRAGDVVGAVAVDGNARLSLARTSGELQVSSRHDLTALYPEASHLPGGGEAALAYVADADGLYAVGVSSPDPLSEGDYRIELEVFRPPLEELGDGARQILFLDFDGAVVDRRDFVGGESDPVHLSGLSTFLPRWGLGPADENALIDDILLTVAENLFDDVRLLGANGDHRSTGVAGEFELELRNSRDDLDPGTASNVARIVVGGTIEELGLQTIGLATEIDPGNLSTAGLAVVLLDLLSGPADDPNSLNGVAHAPSITLAAIVGRALGNITAHEAGHLFGNFHTERDSGPVTLMDRGGRLLAVLGAGDDQTIGTTDDQDVDLEIDSFEPTEGFLGLENTRDVVAFGLPAGGSRPRLVVDPLELDFGHTPPGATVSRSLVLHNAGTVALEISSVDIAGAAAFSLSSPPPLGSLAPGTSRAVDVDFAPSATGDASATLTVSSSDPTRSLTPVPLRGSGGIAFVGVDRTEHDFGTLVYGPADISAATVVEVRNAGTGPLHLSAALGGGTAERFTVDAGSQATVAPGGVHSIALSFRPGGAVGDARASLLIATDDPSATVVGVALSGRSEGPDLEVFPEAPYVFGVLVLGRQGRRAFQLENRGTRALTLQSVTLEEDGAGQMRITVPPRSSVVDPADRESVTVVFEPHETGLAEGLLVVRSSDPDVPRLEVPLLGWGGRPQLVVEPPMLDFGPGPPGIDVERALTLVNLDSYLPLRVQGSIVGSTAFSLADDAQLVDPESSATLQVIFSPPADGAIERADLVLETNDPLEPTTIVQLRAGATLSIPAADPLALAVTALLLALFAWRALRP